MSAKKLTKEDLEQMSYKEIAAILIEENGKPINTASLYKRIIKLLKLPADAFEKGIGDFYTSLSTDKNFTMLDNGKWDLRKHHKSNGIVTDEEDEDEEEEFEELEEDDTDDYDSDNYDDDKEEDDLKDLIIIDDEDDGELEDN